MTSAVHLLALAVTAGATVTLAAQSPAPAGRGSNASIVYCQVGGVGLQRPDDPERFFASAVIEVTTPRTIENPKVTTFDLIDGRGVARTRLRRVVNVLEFTRPRVETEGIAAYYGNSTGNRPWNGVLPVGVTRLQVRVAFDRVPQHENLFDLRCRLTFGLHTIERRVDSEWPT